MNARNLFKMLVIVLLASVVGTLGFSSGAFAARKVCDDSSYPPCNGGGGEETLSNNLSRPTIVFSGGGLTNVTCGTAGVWSEFVPPTEPPDVQTSFLIDPDLYWFVQGVHKWQAPCMTSGTVPLPVTGAWGDNLTGDAKLTVGSPIRVELVVSYDTSTAEILGYEVFKLQPDLLDRASKYGTQAYTEDGGVTYFATTIKFIPGVYDHKAQLRIEKTDGTWVYDQPTTAEINAKGVVVYGYNLRVPTAGDYVITYTLPNVDFNGADAGDCGLPGDINVTNTCSLEITVGGGNGGGGGPRR